MLVSGLSNYEKRKKINAEIEEADRMADQAKTSMDMHLRLAEYLETSLFLLGIHSLQDKGTWKNDNKITGYVTVYQNSIWDREVIKSGFTCFEEIFETLKESYFQQVKVSTSLPKPSFGMITFKVHENGLMEKVQHKEDSSD